MRTAAAILPRRSTPPWAVEVGFPPPHFPTFLVLCVQGGELGIRFRPFRRPPRHISSPGQPFPAGDDLRLAWRYRVYSPRGGQRARRAGLARAAPLRSRAARARPAARRRDVAA